MSENDDLFKRRARRYTGEEKNAIVQDFIRSGKSVKEYCLTGECSQASLTRWIKQSKTKRTGPKRASYSPEEKRHAIEAYFKSGMSLVAFSRTWGLNDKTFTKWVHRYKKDGPKALEPGMVYGTGKKKGPKGLKKVVVNKILEAKKEFPEFGLKKLQQSLRRFQGIKVSPNSIKKILVENESYTPQTSERIRRSEPQIRRFERANPMQLWQSDITSYVLARHKQRVYLVVFMDDHSRYIVSWGLALKQTGGFVIETMFDGLQKFGKPEEILTDQGRQYFSWRGKSEFQKLLHREGVRHVVSRSHHPQTLGKCERFWKTVGKEFWDRANPQELAEAKERFAHFVNHYNHFRPHQGLDGMTPADRFFGVANEVKQSIEATLEENELRLALDQKPRKPVFLIGQIGNQKLTMHGEAGKLVVNTPCGQEHRIEYEEMGHKVIGEKNGEEYNIEPQRENREATCDQEERPKENNEILQASNSSEGPLGGSERGREELSSNQGPSDFRVLDGNDEQDGGCQEVGSESLENLANESTSSFGDVRRFTEATKDKEDDDEQRRRPSLFEKENQTIRRDYSNAGSLNRNLEINARMQASSTADSGEESKEEKGEEKNRSEKEWEKDQEGTPKSYDRKWEHGYFKKDEE